MPPKTKYAREQVVKAAMQVVEKRGSHALTARRVARQLGASTAPVYKHFTNMDELALEVIKETQRRLLDYTSRPWSDRVFLNMGIGVAMFACEHRRLYRALLLEGDSFRDVVHEFLDTLESQMPNDRRFTSLSKDERHVLLSKMWTFTHGLASLICAGLISNCSQEFITNALVDVGSDVIGATLARHEKEDKGE